MRRPGQVLIEMTMAAAGVVVIAFVMARVANWLNQSMVDRNESFQTGRAAAGQSGGLVRFNGPASDLHLIGPGAGRTGGAGQQGASSYPTTCPAGNALNVQAMSHRQTAQTCMQQGEAERQQAIDLSNAAKDLMVVANVLEQLRRDINQCVAELTDLGNQLTACQDRVNQCEADQTSCNTNCTTCQNNCGVSLLGCVAACGPPSPLQPFCIAACNNTYNNTCLPDCDTNYCQTSTCTASCGDCNALQTQTQNKFIECGNLMRFRDTYCGNEAARLGVALVCDDPRSAINAANNKMSQVNGHVGVARARAQCVWNEVGLAEAAERDAIKQCAKK